MLDVGCFSAFITHHSTFCLLPPPFRFQDFSVSAFLWDQGHVLLRKGSAVRRLTEKEWDAMKER
jgi:hypothetical protein